MLMHGEDLEAMACWEAALFCRRFVTESAYLQTGAGLGYYDRLGSIPLAVFNFEKNVLLFSSSF